MTAPRPSRLALAVLDLLVPDHDALKGDLVEDFQVQQSQWWLWRQVLGALFYQCRLTAFRQHQPAWIPVVGTALLVLMSFEVVFAANVVFRLVVGPPPQDVTGYLYLFHQAPPSAAPSGMIAPQVWFSRVLWALVLSIAGGWWLSTRPDGRGRWVVRPVVMIGVVMWTAINLPLPFAAQFLSMLSLLVGFVGGGRLGAALARSSR